MSTGLFRRERVLVLGGLLLVAVALPMVLKGSFIVSLLCQIGIMVVFALSYNMLLGQTGLLSFGHAVYFGMGAFVAMHALNMLGKSGGPISVALLPLVGGAAGLLCGVVLGYVTTKKAGTTFAMISLGIGELVAACSLMFPGFFGGEGGVSGNRVAGKGSLLGITWGPQIEMYWLIIAWAFLCAIAMYALTETPLGRMANAVRDNPERAQFVGYDPRRVRFLMLTLSGGFAGIAGGLSALNYEIVTAESLAAHTSGVVLLMTFVGGTGIFYGPIIGAVLITVLQLAVGGVTKAWLFYFGIFFLFMVLYVPGGIASIIALHRRLWQARLLAWLGPVYLLAAVPAGLVIAALIAFVEMTYALLSHEDAGTQMKLFGFALDAATPQSWVAAGAVAIVGILLLRRAGREVSHQWNSVHLALNRGVTA